MYGKVIKPLFAEFGDLGLTKDAIMRKYYSVFHEMLPTDTLRREVIPQLEAVGLIRQEQDPAGRRRYLVYPTVSPPISSDDADNNMGKDSGVGRLDEFSKGENSSPFEEGSNSDGSETNQNTNMD